MELFEYGSIRAASLVQEEALDLALVNMNFYDIDKMNTFRIQTEPPCVLRFQGSSSCETKGAFHRNVKRRAYHYVQYGLGAEYNLKLPL